MRRFPSTRSLTVTRRVALLVLALGALSSGALPAANAAPRLRDNVPARRDVLEQRLPVAERFDRAAARAALQPGGTRLALVTTVAPAYDIPTFNMGLAELAGYLRYKHRELAHRPARITFIEPDLMLSRTPELAQSVDYTLRKLRATKPHIIGVSAKMGSQDNLIQLLTRLRREPWARDAVIVVGNVMGTFSHATLAERFPEVVFALGEGELAIDAIYRAVKTRRTDLSKIPNVAYRSSDGLVRTPRKVLALERQRWLPALDMLEQALRVKADIGLEASRGCPGHCTFCSVPQLDFKTKPDGSNPAAPWRHFPVTRTAELVRVLRAAGATTLNFVDSEFGSRNPRYLTRLAHQLGKQPGAPFAVDFRLDAFGMADPKLAKRFISVLGLLAHAGLNSVFVGAESGSDEQLRRYGKGYPLDVNLRGIDLLVRAGLRPQVGFITFDPLMTRRDLEANLRFLLRRVGGTATQKGRRVLSYVTSPLNVMRVQAETPLQRLVASWRLAITPEGTEAFYRAEFLDPRMEQLATAAQDWFREIMHLRYPVLQASRYARSPAVRARATDLVERLHALDVLYLKGLLRELPRDPFDRTLDENPARLRLDQAFRTAARDHWAIAARNAAPGLARVGAAFRAKRTALEAELKALCDSGEI
ncbi:MAG: radical SAM protein [Deltaproteobacteria bacterium]|nr:radical SAM protein [Deltaproteobacteria bacterium]